jgi:replication factor C subunit 2/4
MIGSGDLFDDDMVEQTLTNYNPFRNIKDKIPLVDKYRPRNLDEIVQQDEVVKVLKECLRTGNFTHMLFFGASGTGKTSSILAFAMELFGPKIFDKRVIELNASDERGINVVRNRIITFAKSAIGNPDPNYPCPPYKIIILDEADAMTVEAQSALRTVMESSSNVTRFCFICNYINQIIEPIASRCMKFRFKSIGKQVMTAKLSDIAKKEAFDIPDSVMEKIVELAKGDVRNGIILLQYIKYIHDQQGRITVNDIYETTNYLPNEIIQGIWNRCIESKTATVKTAKQEALFLKQKGYSINSILDKLNNLMIENESLTDTQRSLIALNTAKTEKRLIDGADEYVQLFNILAYMQGVFHGRIKN